MDSMLTEILSRIFSYLHIEDRKSVRLVCRRWNECCNCPALVRREKFVFRAGYPIEIVDAFLKRCSCFRSTIEFQGLSLSRLPDASTWRQCGQKILSLSFYECEMSSETTKNIFLYCTNMHSYKLTRHVHFPLGYNTTDSFNAISAETLDELIRLNIERRKMITFQLFVNGVEIAKEVLRKVFKIFPCIRNFGTGYSSYTASYIRYVYDGSLHGIFNPALIKELSFNVPSSGLWLQEFAKVRELKLEKLETILRNPVVPRDVLNEFLRNQTDLRTIKILLLASEEDYCKMLLFEILNVCTSLVDLRFKCEAALKIDEFCQMLQTVSKSNFECLMVWFKYVCSITDDEFFDDDLSVYLAPLSNKSLHTLKLVAAVLDDYCLPILKHFSNLQHLELASVSDRILQTIFQYHVHLRTLVLGKTDYCSVFGFTGREPSVPMHGGVPGSDSTPSVEQKTYSISRLRELRHLELEGFLSYRWIEQTVLEFNFPKLRYLRLSLWALDERVSRRTFEYLPAVIPSVEVLILDEIPLRGHQYAHFCKHLCRLSLLLCSWPDEEKTIDELFILRPSLKYAVDLSDNAYFYDRFTKNLSIFNFRDLEFKIGVFRNCIRS